MEDTIMNDLDYSFNGINSKIEDIVKMLSQNPSEFNKEIWQLIMTLSNILIPIAMSLATAFFVIDFLQKSMHFEFVKWEEIVKIFIKLIIVKAVLENTTVILQYIYDIVAEIIKSMGPVQVNVIGDQLQSISKKVHEMGVMDQWAFYWSMSPWIFILKLVSLVIVLIVYGRFIEIYIYTMAAPIALSTLTSDSFSVGKRFIQNYIAVCFQGVIILAGVMIYGKMFSSGLLGTVGKSDWGIVSNMTIMSLLLLFIVTKSGSWSKQILGGG